MPWKGLGNILRNKPHQLLFMKESLASKIANIGFSTYINVIKRSFHNLLLWEGSSVTHSVRMVLGLLGYSLDVLGTLNTVLVLLGTPLQWSFHISVKDISFSEIKDPGVTGNFEIKVNGALLHSKKTMGALA